MSIHEAVQTAVSKAKSKKSSKKKEPEVDRVEIEHHSNGSRTLTHHFKREQGEEYSEQKPPEGEAFSSHKAMLKHMKDCTMCTGAQEGGTVEEDGDEEDY